MSNNIYNILGKLNALTPKEETPKESKPIYESVEAKGSIVAGIKSVEQKLREQFEAMKNEERETLKTKTGTIYKGGKYGNADYDSEGKPAKKGPIERRKNADGTVKKGRPSKAEKAAKGDGEKSYSSPKGDIFGRTTGSVPKGKKGTVVKGKGNVDTVDEDVTNPFAVGMAQAKKEVGLGRAKTSVSKKVEKRGHEIGKAIKRDQVSESISLRESPAALPHIINKYKNEVKRFMNGDDLDSDLYEALFDYYSDAGEIPYGTMKGRTGDPYEWVTERFDQDVHDYVVDEAAPRGPSFAPQHPGTPAPAAKPSFLDKAKDFGKKAVGATLNTLGHGSDEELLAKLPGTPPNRFNEEDDGLNELAKLAGLRVSEANDGNLANNAKPYDKVTRGDVVAGRLGKDEQGGKKEVDEANDGNLANNAKPFNKVTRGDVIAGRLGKDKQGVAEGPKPGSVASQPGYVAPEWDKEDDEDADYERGGQQGFGSREFDDDNESIAECMSPMASGAAEMQQQQGRISVNTNSSSDGNNNITISADGEAAEQLMAMLKMAGLGGGAAHAQQAEIVVAQEAKKYGDTDVKKPADVLNTPRPEVQGMDRSTTTGFNKGTDDLNKPKSQHPTTAAKGDNPLTKKEKTIEDFNPIDQLGAQLMAEYQSIKLQK